MNFGDKFKELRISKGYSLRSFCLKFEIDASNLSKVERNVKNAPPPETLDKYISYLEVEKDSNLWFELHDLASISRKTLPKDILEDEELVEKMPVFFRAARNKEKISGKEIVKELKDIIKSEWQT